MWYLNANDIEAAVDRSILIEKMETAMRLAETGDIVMPPRTYVEYGDNSLALMPCFAESGFSTKLVTIFPGNQTGPDPVVNGLVVLNDIRTGVPRAILNGQALTAIRTGAVGAVGVKHLAVFEPHALGLVGAGAQGFEQVLCAAEIRTLTDVYVHDRDVSKVGDFMTRLKKRLPCVRIRSAAGADEMLAVCRTIVLSTTSSQPVLPDSEVLLKGKCLIATGSYRPDMQELPRAAFVCAGGMLLDTLDAKSESGDIIRPLAQGWLREEALQTMGQFLLNRKEKEALQGETTIFKSVGMAFFDLMAAQYIFESARTRGLGKEIDS
ncbi:MAG: ornithine cyclodeaminase family protein [Pseudomonadota bacterium]